ncbi:cyclomaltodextrinase N-terminal domain-containing protein [Flavobacterium sp. D11R37]|uniref:glycoside hydrolase family 13 protein n=1 Tax=Flavobacterium coralii TaxID=2838017 RepID=UPI001CA6D756|nr:glycoside hydrolase family 13 protein [Flavobacterium coralii]MBY8963422.1 cyclomaltodextrinase N-terminal domain-containing protein [Flavobacterium coralii]
MNKIFYIFLFCCTAALAQVERVEPPFWYAGMHNPELQVMFYGKDIAKYTPTVNNGVVIKNVVKTENPNYVFVTIDTKDIPASDFVFTFKDKNKAAFTQKYTLRQRKEGSALREGFDSSDLIYLIMPDRFANGNPANDNAEGMGDTANRNEPFGRHGGDIQGIINNLDYIEQLGATALWSTPLCEDRHNRGSYHGYAQTDVYKIDPRYGTNEDYLRLSQELKKRDMKLILDYVTNHWGSEHWMYKDLPTYDWVHQFPGYAQSNYRMTTQFDPNASDVDSRYCMDGWFVSDMPDLNQSNPLVLNYLTQNAIWWIEYADLDGFRVDTYSYNDKEGIAKWTKAIMDEYPHFNIVGEVWMHDQAQMAYWQKDSKIAAIQSYNSYLPSVMDFTLHDAFGNVFNEDNAGWDSGMQKVYDNFTNDFLYPDINNILVFAENHDTGRFNEIYKNDFNKYKMAMALLATVRGIPQIYYGTEIGMAGDKGKGDGDIRRDFSGGWQGDKNNAFTQSGRTAEQQKWFEFSSKLFNWRKSKEVIHTGKTTHYLPYNNVYVYFRHNDKETVMVAINNSDKEQAIDTARYRQNIKGYTKGRNVIEGNVTDVTKQITLQSKSVIILELQ